MSKPIFSFVMILRHFSSQTWSYLYHKSKNGIRCTSSLACLNAPKQGMGIICSRKADFRDEKGQSNSRVWTKRDNFVHFRSCVEAILQANGNVEKIGRKSERQALAIFLLHALLPAETERLLSECMKKRTVFNSIRHIFEPFLNCDRNRLRDMKDEMKRLGYVEFVRMDHSSPIPLSFAVNSIIESMNAFAYISDKQRKYLFQLVFGSVFFWPGSVIAFSKTWMTKELQLWASSSSEWESSRCDDRLVSAMADVINGTSRLELDACKFFLKDFYRTFYESEMAADSSQRLKKVLCHPSLLMAWLKAFSHTQSFDMMNRLLADYFDSQTFDDRAVSLVLDGLLKCGQTVLARSLFQACCLAIRNEEGGSEEMVTRSLNVWSHHWLNALTETPRSDNSHEYIYEKNNQSDVSSIFDMCENSCIEHVISVFLPLFQGGKRGDQQVKPDRITCNIFLSFLARFGTCDHADIVINFMNENGLVPDVFTLSPLIKIYGRHGNFEKAVEIYRHLQQLGQVGTLAFDILIETCCGASRAGGKGEFSAIALNCLQHYVQTLQKTPTIKTFCRLLILAAKDGHKPLAEFLVDFYEANRLPYKTDAHALSLYLYVKATSGSDGWLDTLEIFRVFSGLSLKSSGSEPEPAKKCLPLTTIDDQLLRLDSYSDAERSIVFSIFMCTAYKSQGSSVCLELMNHLCAQNDEKKKNNSAGIYRKRFLLHQYEQSWNLLFPPARYAWLMALMKMSSSSVQGNPVSSNNAGLSLSETVYFLMEILPQMMQDIDDNQMVSLTEEWNRVSSLWEDFRLVSLIEISFSEISRRGDRLMIMELESSIFETISRQFSHLKTLLECSIDYLKPLFDSGIMRISDALIRPKWSILSHFESLSNERAKNLDNSRRLLLGSRKFQMSSDDIEASIDEWEGRMIGSATALLQVNLKAVFEDDLKGSSDLLIEIIKSFVTPLTAKEMRMSRVESALLLSLIKSLSQLGGNFQSFDLTEPGNSAEIESVIGLSAVLDTRFDAVLLNVIKVFVKRRDSEAMQVLLQNFPLGADCLVQSMSFLWLYLNIFAPPPREIKMHEARNNVYRVLVQYCQHSSANRVRMAKTMLSNGGSMGLDQLGSLIGIFPATANSCIIPKVTAKMWYLDGVLDLLSAGARKSRHGTAAIQDAIHRFLNK